MKRIGTVLGIVLLVSALAIPVLAWGPGYGRDGHMMGNQGSGYGRGGHMMGTRGPGPGYRGSESQITTEQRNQLETLGRKFYDETKDLRDQVWTKSRDLDVAMNETNPDLEKARSLQKEISELRAQLAEKSLNHELEARKILPDQQFGSGYGRGPQSRMGSYGRGMGYGARGCWN